MFFSAGLSKDNSRGIRVYLDNLRIGFNIVFSKELAYIDSPSIWLNLMFIGSLEEVSYVRLRISVTTREAIWFTIWSSSKFVIFSNRLDLELAITATIV